MTQTDARQAILSAAQVRRAVETIAEEQTKAVLLSWSEQVYNALKAEHLTAADISVRGGPSERTVGLMMKASNPRVSTMVELASALSSPDADYEIEIRLVRKPKP